MIEKYLKQSGNQLCFVFRVLVGIMFFLHGAQKFGWLGGDGVPLWSLFGAAGTIETVAGALIVLGLLTRWAALVSAVEMLAAYLMMHAPNGWNPLMNKGELALLYFATFLVISHHGALKWGVDNQWLKH
ncbi:MAG: DoxX family protein [Nanoarchaeota archaeon]